jgi:prepilin-type N-terminal cleavage/methylation domain-containing protein
MKTKSLGTTPCPKSAFTLIELLIVVAIIAILAAIAVPNFLEAQVRSKVSRVRADHRTIVTGLEVYYLDNNKYPPTPYTETSIIRVIPNLLSTPVAYITTVGSADPFLGPNVGDFQIPGNKVGGVAPLLTWVPCTTDAGCVRSNGVIVEPTDAAAGKRYYYQSHFDVEPRRTAGVVLGFQTFSIPAQGAWVITSLGPDRARDFSAGDGPSPVIPGKDVYVPYDATNGTVSEGDIVRSQKEAEGKL